MNRTLQSILVALCVVAAAHAQTEQILKLEAPGKQDFKFEKDKLIRGSRDYTIKAITVPDIARPGTPLGDVTTAMNHIAEVGGAAICFDLYGISPDGSSVSEEALEAMRNIRLVGEYRGMVGVVRLFGPQAPTERKARLEAARTLGEALAGDKQYVYLIEGKDAGKLTKYFSRNAPDLVVASEDNGELTVFESEADIRRKKPALIKSLPESFDDQMHFVLPEGDASYAAFDARMADPAESQPWTPDNSVLSDEERAEGFIALFDGKSLNGWIVQGANKSAWQAHDGILERVDGGSNGLRTVRKYENFILRWEWNLPNGGNNGVHLHAPRGARASKIGMEYQMMGDHGEPVTPNSTGSVYDVIAPSENAVKPTGEWNTSEVYMNWPHLKYVLNGVTVIDTDMDAHEDLKYRLRTGFIVLTEHSASVQYRNVRLKPL